MLQGCWVYPSACVFIYMTKLVYSKHLALTFITWYYGNVEHFSYCVAVWNNDSLHMWWTHTIIPEGIKFFAYPHGEVVTLASINECGQVGQKVDILVFCKNEFIP